jgi:hypothetical protein
MPLWPDRLHRPSSRESVAADNGSRTKAILRPKSLRSERSSASPSVSGEDPASARTSLDRLRLSSEEDRTSTSSSEVKTNVNGKDKQKAEETFLDSWHSVSNRRPPSNDFGERNDGAHFNARRSSAGGSGSNGQPAAPSAPSYNPPPQPPHLPPCTPQVASWGLSAGNAHNYYKGIGNEAATREAMKGTPARRAPSPRSLQL